jgi:hypothetical protein
MISPINQSIEYEQNKKTIITNNFSGVGLLWFLQHCINTVR